MLGMHNSQSRLVTNKLWEWYQLDSIAFKLRGFIFLFLFRAECSAATSRIRKYFFANSQKKSEITPF